MSDVAKLKFSDESKKLKFEDRSAKLIFADESKKLIFDIIIVSDVVPGGIGIMIIEDTFIVG